MSDDRPFVRQDRSGMVGSFGTLTATINRAYATHHGYGFFFGQIAKNTCVHPKLGVRHSAWCKILVIAHVLIEGIAGSSCSNILYIDTDAYVTNFTLSIDGFLERARERGDESIPDYKDGPWELLFASDFWFHPEELNTGVFFVRGGKHLAKRSCGLLRRWWDANFKSKNLAKPWEQVPIQAMYLHLQGKPGPPPDPPQAGLFAPWGSRIRVMPTARFFHRAEAQWAKIGAQWTLDYESENFYSENDFIHHGVRAVCCHAVTTLQDIMRAGTGIRKVRSGRRGPNWDTFGKLPFPPLTRFIGTELAAVVFSNRTNDKASGACPRAIPVAGTPTTRLKAFDHERTCCHRWRRRNHSHHNLDGTYTATPRPCWREVRWEHPVFSGQVWTC